MPRKPLLAALAFAMVHAVAAPRSLADPAGAAPAAFRKPPPPPSADPKIAFEKYKLANGLEVILAPDPAVPLVSVHLWYHVGSGLERPGKTGFAHLFEHMMFQGSTHVGEDRHFEILKKIGVDQINGSTNTDRTDYFEVVPSNQLETALWLESDRMGWMLELITKKSLDNQIDVVRNERRQRYDNVPYSKARFALAEAMYPAGHPYRYLTIGKHEDLTNASLDDVKGFFRTWYVPANATLALVGDFEPAEAKRLIERWFATLPASTKPAVVPVPAPVVAAREIRIEDDRLAKLPQMTFAWHSPASYADGDAELDIVADVLGRDGTGRLYKALVYERLAQDVSVFQSAQAFSGRFQVTVTLRSGASPDEVKRRVLEAIAQVRREPLTAKEIQRLAARNEAGAIRRLETVLGRSSVLQEYNHFLGDPGKLSWDLDRYRTATAEKIRAVADAYLAPEHMITVVTVPVQKAGR